MAAPADSAARASIGALRESVVGPVRILTVTGTSTAATTASMMRRASPVSPMSAEPAARLQTFLAGQPMLMSITWAPRSTLKRAASAIMAGSPPAIWTARGSISPAWSMRRDVLTLCQRRGLEAAISDTA